MTTKMYISDDLTLSAVQAVMDRVQPDFLPEGRTLAGIAEDKYTEAAEFIKNNFILSGEPLANAFGVEWGDDMVRLIHYKLRKNMSFMVLDEDRRVIGLFACDPVKVTENHSFDPQQITYKPLRDLISFLEVPSKEVDFFNRFGVDEAVKFSFGCVHPDFRKTGLARKMFQCGVALCSELGFKAIKVEATSKYSQRICEEEGFTVLYELPYDQFFYEGQPLSNKTGPHYMYKIFGKALSVDE